MKFKPIYLVIFLCVLASFFIWQNYDSAQKNNHQGVVEAVNNDRIIEIPIESNSTFGLLMTEAGISQATTTAILFASEDVYDLSNIRVGRSLFLFYDNKTDEFKQLVYQIDSEEELYVIKNQNNEWLAERRLIEYEITEKTLEGQLESSLYQWALDNDIDIRVIIDLADAYQWTIDFAIDPRVGDSFKFIYEERFRDGEYKMPGKILAAKYINEGEEFQIYYFEEDSEVYGHYNENGTSVQKELLKAPIHYSYISSSFTTGLRCLSYYSLCTNHRAIDYVAPIGTPIRSVGDGTVVSAGWNSGGYGYMVKIRHNDTYTTLYGHMSQILVSYGEKVKQGDIIGKVGSTGLSTGPHLHYEIIKHGTKINPLTLELPPGEPIKEENKERFYQSINIYQETLNKIYTEIEIF